MLCSVVFLGLLKVVSNGFSGLQGSLRVLDDF